MGLRRAFGPLPPTPGYAILLSVWLTRFEPLERGALWIWQRLPLPWRARSALYWLVSTKYGIGVQALVFDDAGRLLLLRHTYKGRYAWGLPGGGMSRGETPTAAILREVREEAGLDATVRGLLGVEAHPSRLIVEIFYLCEAHGGTFRANAEIADYGYFALAELPERLEPRLRRLILHYAGDGRLLAGTRREIQPIIHQDN
jgi:ADP-ribose pyrophosphatase YjhB (NUDIX family)